jgi:hypothetical protein
VPFQKLNAAFNETENGHTLVRKYWHHRAPDGQTFFGGVIRLQPRVANRVDARLGQEAVGLTAKQKKASDLELLRDLYSGKHEPLKAVFLKELYDLLEKVTDRCRDSGNVINHIVLKNS